jgi:WD40 repeat protein
MLTIQHLLKASYHRRQIVVVCRCKWTNSSNCPAVVLFYYWRQFEKIFVSLDGTAVPVSTSLHVWQVKGMLRGHEKRITGLAFSNALNVLVSSGADAQVLVFRSFSIISMYEDPVLQNIVLCSMEFWLHISLVPPGKMCLFSYFLLLHRCLRGFCQNEVSTVTLVKQMM